ncbi:MAG: hypothetical protein HY537_09165 [Deltaproteobacteria bacterium]|nr:hypothetical protein [Deltaproteobacteria bacterium]
MQAVRLLIFVSLLMTISGCFTGTQPVKGTFTQLGNPVVSLKDMPAMVRGNAIYKIQFYATAAEALSVRQLILQVSITDGPFTNLAVLPGQATDYQWKTPEIDAKNIRLKLVGEDSMGKVSEIISSFFEIRTRGPLFSQTMVPSRHVVKDRFVFFAGACEADYPIVVSELSGKQLGTPSCNSGKWSIQISTDKDGERQFLFTQADPVGNATTLQAQWISDATAPTVSSLVSERGQVSPTNFVPLSMSLADQISNVTDFCLKYITDFSSSVNPNDSCWIRVDRPGQPNVPVSKQINIAQFYYTIGFTEDVYRVALFCRDEAGNISLPATCGDHEKISALCEA